VSIVGRVRLRYRRMHAQAPELRVPFMVIPVHQRSPLLMRHRLRAVVGTREGAAFVREVRDSGLTEQLEAAEAEYRTLAPDFATGSVHPREGTFLYALVRALRPATIIETGTASGISTSYLLGALHRNGFGRLISIDLPFEAGGPGELLPIVAGTSIAMDDSSPVPPGKDPGWAVPAELRGRWDLRLGDARELLPEALAEVETIDVFFHDSLHTREHMLFEFEAAWSHLVPGGILVADDVFQREHDALPAFARSVERPFTTFGNLGLIRK
jgi:predicted O-methyltransferase YrrM